MKTQLIILCLGLIFLTGSAFTSSTSSDAQIPPKSLSEEYRLFKKRAMKLKLARKQRPKDRKIRMDMVRLVKHFEGRVNFYTQKDEEEEKELKEQCIKQCVEECKENIPLDPDNGGPEDEYIERMECYQSCDC